MLIQYISRYQQYCKQLGLIKQADLGLLTYSYETKICS